LSPAARIALVAIFVAIWFATLGYRSLIQPDEGRYAEIPREMVQTGDWLTPRLNALKYFEKPPLQYWATAATFAVFGLHEWAARLWPGLTGFLGVLLVYFAGRRLFGARAALLAAAVLGSSFLDMGLSFFLEVALVGFLLAQRAPPGSREERNWMIAAWIAMALAMLSKGLIGLVLPAATLVVYSALQRDLEPWRRLHFGVGILVFLLVGAPWFIAVSVANPEFPRFFFIHEHFERFLTKEHGRYQPPWYFGPILLLGLLPWTTIALHSLARAWNVSRSRIWNERRFLLLWVCVIFLFFSASSSKLPSYILPVFPAVALLTGDAMERLTQRQIFWHLVLVGIGVLGLSALLPRIPALASPEEPEYAAMLLQYRIWLVDALIVLGIGTLVALWCNQVARSYQALLALAAAAFLFAVLALLGHDKLGRSNSAHYIAEELRRELSRPELRAGVPFYSVQMYDQTLPFYLGRTLTLVDYGDEFVFGQSQEPERSIKTMQEFEKRWREDREAFAVMTEDTYKQLDAEKLPMRVVARDSRRIIVAKP
jgi:4-amino-4-deoxy-L-arabinose transferase-like glycosyltransferase